ncbi:MAG: hypothetical protein AB7O32_08925 [Vicinamibacterales bacterium]
MAARNHAVPDDVSKVIKEWPREPRESAERLIEYYGPPDEHSASQLTWHTTHDGWKRTVLSREQTPHNFPSPHADFLEQFIDYHVPIEMFTPLAEFDGSVIAERTKGELSARCGGTSMNFVAINLAHDIVTRKCSVAEARDRYTRLYAAYKHGEKPAYTQAFQFDVPSRDTLDPDVQTLDGR